MWVGVITFFLGSLVVAEVGRRGKAGDLPRNGLVGLRVRRTLEQDESWDVAHRAAGSTLIATGLAGAGLAVTAGLIGATVDEDAVGGALLVASVIVVGGVLVSAQVGLRALDETRRSDSDDLPPEDGGHR